LAQNNIQNTCGGVLPNGGALQTATGKISRISSVQQGTNTIYYILVAGQHNIFTANLSLSPKLPFAQAGDTVTITYFNNSTNSPTVTLQSFNDTTINLGTATPTASPTPGAGTGTPTVSPTP